jgi:hypothetical protein
MRPFKRREKWELKDGKWQQVLLERHVVREIMDRLWLQAKIKVWQINQPYGGKVKQNVSGIPDLIGFIPWRTPMTEPASPNYSTAALPLFIEVKRPGGHRRLMQKLFIEEARAGGAIAFFAESWCDVVREFKNIGIKLEEKS